MSENGRFKYDPVGDFGRAVDRKLSSFSEAGRRKIKAADRFVRGRRLTSAERAMVEAMFGPNPGYAHALIYPRNFWWPYPNDRAMAPAGHIHFPSQDLEADFSLGHVKVERKALFMHEATHLYQWYALKQWVILRGLRDRDYRYDLVPGRPLANTGWSKWVRSSKTTTR